MSVNPTTGSQPIAMLDAEKFGGPRSLTTAQVQDEYELG